MERAGTGGGSSCGGDDVTGGENRRERGGDSEFGGNPVEKTAEFEGIMRSSAEMKNLKKRRGFVGKHIGGLNMAWR